MNRYPAYKEVDLPWLSEMPQQWCLVRNRDIFTEKTDVVGDDFSNYTLLSLTTKGVIPRDLESGKGKFPSDFKSYKIVHKNDIAFCLFDIETKKYKVIQTNYNEDILDLLYIGDNHFVTCEKEGIIEWEFEEIEKEKRFCLII